MRLADGRVLSWSPAEMESTLAEGASSSYNRFPNRLKMSTASTIKVKAVYR